MSFDNTEKIAKVFYDNRDQLLRLAITKISLVNYDYVKVEEIVDDSLLITLKAKICKTDDAVGWQQIKRYLERVIRSLLFKEGIKINENVSKWNKKYHREYSKKHKDKLNRYYRGYYLKNKEALKQRTRKWNAENKEKKKSVGRDYYLKNKKAHNERSKKYYHENKEKNKKQRHGYYLKNRAKTIEKSAIWANENKDRVIAIQRRNQKENIKKLKDPYIRDLLKRIGLDPTPELIETQRIILKIKRHVKSKSPAKHP